MPDITVQDLIRREATAAGIPPEFALAVAEQESGFNPGAVGPSLPSGARAIGTFQLLPETAKTLGVDPSDPVQNIQGGVRYLRQLLDQHNGDPSAALKVYGGVVRDQSYVPAVLQRLQKYTTAAPTPGKAPVSASLQAAVPKVGAPPPKPPNPSQFEQPEGPGVLRQVGSLLTQGVDPRTRTGRRNLAGAVGAIGGGMLASPTAAVSGPVGPATGAVAGAMTMGALEEAGEGLVDRFVGQKPPSYAEILANSGRAATEQGLYEMGGQALLWPVRAIGRRVAASKMSQQVAAQLETALNAAQQAVRGARTAGRAGVSAAKTSAQTAVEAAERPYAALVGNPPLKPTTAGELTQAVLQGPAKTARDLAGQAVEQAAATGPKVDITGLKAEAQRIIDKELAPSAVEFPREVPETPASILSAAGVSPAAAGRLSPQAQAAVHSVQQAQQADLVKHPAMGVLTRILNAEDSVPFAAAHQFKRELDDALLGTQDKVLKKRVTAITQHLRGDLRSAMTGHTPYDLATSAYAQIAPLYTKGIAPQLRRLATDSPEAVIRLIKGNEPTKAAMLKELLTTQAAAGGDAAAGQTAWDSVRATWTQEKILKGGIDGITDRLDKLDPEFAKTLYGDASGQKIVANLRAIQTAYERAVADGKIAVEHAREASRTGVEAATAAVRDVRQTARSFSKSSIPQQRDLNSTAADVLRAAALGPGSFWGAFSIGRLLHGPKAADLLAWAAFSSTNTQRLVAAITSPIPGQALADLFRASGVGAPIVEGRAPESPSPSGAAQIGTPPPRPPAR